MTTVADVLDSVQLRLGMTRDSMGWVTQRPVVHDMLVGAVEMLDDAYRDRNRYVPTRLLTPNTQGAYNEPETLTTYRVPENCDPDYIDSLSVLYSGVWTRIPKGITDSMRNDAYSPGATFSAWDVIECDEIELWPHVTDDPPSVRISYTRKPIDYTDEDSCLDTDRQLLIMLTLDSAIPFYGRPDAEANNRHLNRHLQSIRAKQLKGLRYTVGAGRNRGNTPDRADLVYAHPVVN